MKKTLSIITAMVIAGSISSNAFAAENLNIKRIYGQDRYKTSFNICNSFSDGKTKNVIVASGSDFADALAGSALSKKLNAPIILTGNSKQESRNCIEYIKNNVDQDGKVFILGGNASVSENIVQEIKSLGYTDITRLGGQDRFATNKSIVTQGNIAKGTPIVVANAYGFADALSVSSIASIKGYPIVMTSRDGLSNDIKKIIGDVQPSEIFVIGGQGSVSDKVVEEIKGLAPKLDNSKITRLGGLDRYETSMKVVKHFDLNTNSAVIANGEAFPDALSGSALASKVNAPIILTNGKDIATQKEYMDTKNYSNLYILGGIGVVDLTTEYTLKSNSISDTERKEIDDLLLTCKLFFDATIEEDKNLVDLNDKIESSFNSIENAKNLEEIQASFTQFVEKFTNTKNQLQAYERRLGNIKSIAEKIQCQGSISILKGEYLENIDRKIAKINRIMDFVNSYINWSQGVAEAVNSQDAQALNLEMKKIASVLNMVEEIQNMKSGDVEIGDVGLKLVSIKNAINTK